jgi:hypothetical protein
MACLFLLRIPCTYAIDFCHPAPNPKLAQYIIAYGSLMQTKSKNATNRNSGANRPVIVDHYRRGWFAKGESVGFSTTYLGVTQNTNAHFNGSIFYLPQASYLNNYDKREKYYCRKNVALSSIHTLDHRPLAGGEYWIYESKAESIAEPSKKYPIVESYVDIFLSGCLEIEKKFHLKNFAAECINTTHNWSRYWVNDRIFPRRPTAFYTEATEIDLLLDRNIGHFFKKIRLEPANA